MLFLPGSVITLAGGALFGPVWGTFYSLTGATAGAAAAFLVARYLASDWVHRKAGGWTKQLIEGVDKEGWRFVAFVRLVLLFPFNLLNYALGLTRIPLAVICRSKRMSVQALELLRHAGFKQALLVENGMLGWRTLPDQSTTQSSS